MLHKQAAQMLRSKTHAAMVKGPSLISRIARLMCRSMRVRTEFRCLIRGQREPDDLPPGAVGIPKQLESRSG